MTQLAGEQDRSELEEILAWIDDLAHRITPLEPTGPPSPDA
jgi:hypothetical protein